MKIQKKYLLIPTLVTAIVFAAFGLSFCQDKKTEAKFSFTHNPDEDMIFIALRRSSTDKSASSKVVQDAKFTIAEYYFKHNDLSDAFRAFRELTVTYQPSVSTLLAKIYLYKIALIKNDKEVAESLKKEMFGKSFILLFSSFKELDYTSGFNNHYQVHYYLDRIEVFLNGGVFEEFTP